MLHEDNGVAGLRILILLALVILALPPQLTRAAVLPEKPAICCADMKNAQPCEGCAGAPAGQHSKCCVDLTLQLFVGGRVMALVMKPFEVASFAAPFHGCSRNDPPLLTPPRAA